MEKFICYSKEGLRYFKRAEIFSTAAQMAYFLLLSLFPLLLFFITLIGYLTIDSHQFAGIISSYAPAPIADYIHVSLKEIAETKNGGLLSVGVLGTIWSASNAINALKKALNRAYGKEEKRSFFMSRLVTVGLTGGMLAILIIAFLLPIFGQIIGVHLFALFGLSQDFLKLWSSLRWVVSSIIFIIVLAMLYKLAPNQNHYFKDVLIGAVLATFAWQGVSLAFSFYVSQVHNYTAAYGSLAAVIMLLVWIYLSAAIILAGGAFNAFLQDKKAVRE